MPKVDDIIKKMLFAPNSIRFTDAKLVLEHYGFLLVRQKGSHAQFRNQQGDVITIKKDSLIKAVYVKDILRRIGVLNVKTNNEHIN